jgi:hypothetical protein
LPKDLDAAIKRLDDQELDRLASAVLEERARRKKPPLVEEHQQKRQAEAVALSLPQGKLNAVRAAFKAGVTPARIAREFGLSRSDVQRALAGDGNKQCFCSRRSGVHSVVAGQRKTFDQNHAI